MQCYFCSREAHGKCYWPVEGFVVDEVGNLKVGEIVKRYKEARETSTVATVHELTRLDGKLMRYEILIRRNPGTFKSLVVNDFARVRVKRQYPCGLSVCEEHLMALGPGMYLCHSHWQAWDKVA